MLPRGRIDIGWSDLVFALGLRSSEAHSNIEQRIERIWSPGRTLVTLSVRTGFDALLQALELPRGSEILVSAITIRDIVRIVEAHGLVPIPIDLDMETLSVKCDLIERNITPRTKAILIAHIFGSCVPLDGIASLARKHNLLLIEDCAQSFSSQADRGFVGADVSMFSFGPIKTNTALAGAVLTIRDPELLACTRGIVAAYPVQDAALFRKRVIKYMGIKAISNPTLYGLMALGSRAVGKTHDDVVSHALRGFPGPDLLSRIRMQPSALLLALLERRLTTFDARQVERRIDRARRLSALIPDVDQPGKMSPHHTYWVFPIRVSDPDTLMRDLWSKGFDATRGASSLAVVEPPIGRPETEPTEARQTMGHLLYLTFSPLIRKRDLERLAIAVNEGLGSLTSSTSRLPIQM
jgi:perosamine synthetase